MTKRRGRVFYKYIAEDGLDEQSKTLRWAPEKAKARRGAVVRHPSSKTVGPHPAYYLSAADNPHDWQWWGPRLLELEPVNPAEVRLTSDLGADEYGATAWRIRRELDPFTVLLGPQGREIRAFVDRVGELTTVEDCELLDAKRVATRKDLDLVVRIALDAGRDPTSLLAHPILRGIASDGTGYGFRCVSTRDALWALVVRDLIGTHESLSGVPFDAEVYERLTRPCRELAGPLHPRDATIQLEPFSLAPDPGR